MATATPEQIQQFGDMLAQGDFPGATLLARGLGFSDPEIASYVATLYPNNPNALAETTAYLSAIPRQGSGMLSGGSNIDQTMTGTGAREEQTLNQNQPKLISSLPKAQQDALKILIEADPLKYAQYRTGSGYLAGDVLNKVATIASMGVINDEGKLSPTAIRNLDIANKTGGVIMLAAAMGVPVQNIGPLLGGTGSAEVGLTAADAAVSSTLADAGAATTANLANTVVPTAGGGTVPLVAGGTAAVTGASGGGTTVVPTGGGGSTPVPVPTGGGQWYENPAFWTGMMQLGGGYLNTQAGADAAKAQAEAQTRAAEIAAEAAKLRPIGYDTAFSQFKPKYDEKGNFVGVENVLDPTFQAQQDRLKAYSNIGLDQFVQGVNDSAPMRQGATGMMTRGNDAMLLGDEIFRQASQYAPNPAEARALAERQIYDAQRVGALGSGYLTGSPQDQAAKYMADQQALLAPQRATDLANLQANLQATGRAGLAVGGDAGMMAANPQLQAYYNALRQQDLGLAAQATQGGMDYAKFGTGLMGEAQKLQGNAYQTQAQSLDPYKQALGLGMETTKYGAGMLGSGGDMLQNMYKTQNAAFTPYGTVMSGLSNIEGLRQNALDVGVSLGSKETAARAQGGQLLAQGMTNAANTIGQQQMQAGSPFGNLLSGAGNAINQYQQNQQNMNMFNQYMNRGPVR